MAQWRDAWASTKNALVELAYSRYDLQEVPTHSTAWASVRWIATGSASSSTNSLIVRLSCMFIALCGIASVGLLVELVAKLLRRHLQPVSRSRTLRDQGSGGRARGQSNNRLTGMQRVRPVFQSEARSCASGSSSLCATPDLSNQSVNHCRQNRVETPGDSRRYPLGVAKIAALRRHIDLDDICPITSHTPPEEGCSWPGCDPHTNSNQILPQVFGSPCSLCEDAHQEELIKHGHLKRRLPCNHEFHASCIDRFFMAESMNGGCRHGFYCPSCGDSVRETGKDRADQTSRMRDSPAAAL